MPTLSHLLRSCAALSLPLIFLLVIALGVVDGLIPRKDPEAAPATVEFERPQGRTILVIVDSLREQAVHDHMPTLEAIREAQGNAWRPVKTCSANFTISCIQTMLSGKESPFSSGLHNFTGKASQSLGVPGQIARTPLVQDVISDYTIGSLYGSVTRREINVEQWKGSWLDHDLESIELASTWLTQPEGAPDVLILHVVGTDKVAHRLHPGHPEYADHFTQVDTALKGLFEHIDPRRDHLIITGDHGHDERGFHTHDSLMIVQSPWLADLLNQQLAHIPQLAQTEIAYLLAATTHTAPPTGYEGRYLALDTGSPAPPALMPMRAQLAAQLAQRDESNLRAKLAALQQERKQAPWHAMMRMLPLLLFYLLWCLEVWPTSSRRDAHRPGSWYGAHAAVFWGMWWTGQALPAWWSVAMALGVSAWMGRRFMAGPLVGKRPELALLGVPLVVVVGISLLGERWRLTMHANEGSTWASPVFFGVLIALGVALSWLATRHATKRLPEAIGLLCFLGLPSGVYYYHFGQNITRSFLIGGALLLIYRAWRHRDTLQAMLKSRRHKGLAALYVMSCVMLLWQYSGAWHWYSGLEMWVRAQPVWSIWAIYAALGSGVVWSMRTQTWRVCVSALLAVTAVYSVWVGELPAARAVSTLTVALAMASWLALTSRAERDDVRDGAWWAALFMMLCWTVFRGFEIDHVDFNFSFTYLTGLHTERDIAIASSVMTHTKYALFLGFPVMALADARPNRWHTVLGVGMLVLHARLIALLGQVAFGPLYTQEKLYELAITDLAFIVGMMLWIIGIATGVTLIHRRMLRHASHES